MNKNYKGILIQHFSGLYKGRISRKLHTTLYNDNEVKAAFEHYENCRNPLCESCHLARILETNKSSTELNKYIQYRTLIKGLCKSKSIHDSFRKTAIETIRSNYRMYLKTVYLDWRGMKQRVVPNEAVNQECSICHEKYSDVIALSCGHCFCQKCVCKVENCPLCRETIVFKLKIYL